MAPRYRRRRRSRPGASTDPRSTSLPGSSPLGPTKASSFRFEEAYDPVNAFRPLSLPCKKEEEEEDQVAEPASVQTLQEPDVSSLEKLLDTTRLDASSITARSSTPGSSMIMRKPRDWYLKFYIRMDRGDSYHTYPHLGGPFQSLQEADNAIDRHIQDLRHPTMWKEQVGVSAMDRRIQRSLYWPDGTCKLYSRSRLIETSCKQLRHLVEALVDKYNEDHDLLGDHAYVLKDVLQYQIIIEGAQRYSHFNFTATKGPDCGMNNLFFAEVMHMKVEPELVVSCLQMIESNANGDCHGCTNNGSVDMKHPSSRPCPYTGGHLDVYLPCGPPSPTSRNFYDENLETEEDAIVREKSRLRHIFKGLDDPGVRDKIFGPARIVTMKND